MKTYRASYKNQAANMNAQTKFWYANPESAQDALMRTGRVGHFAYLGTVAGDLFENGRCDIAPRNGGEVRIEAS